MAYSKTPTVDTYQTKRVPMMFENEGKTYLQQNTVAQNILFELYKGEQTGDGYFEVLKRPGIDAITSSDSPYPILGIYYSETLNTIVWVYGGLTGGTIHVQNSAGVLIYDAPGMFTTIRTVGFTEFLYQDGHIDIIITDGTGISVINVLAGSQNLLTPIPNVGLHRAYPIYLDGYLFLADEKGNIWNSNLNNPLVFSPSNFLSAEAYPDTIATLARVDNYIVALGSYSIEYFYDAANLNGSPLARYDSGSKPFGILARPAILGNSIYLVGNPQGGGYGVYLLENFKLTKISNATVDRMVRSNINIAGSRQALNVVNMAGHTTIVYSRWVDNGVPPPPGFKEMLQYDLENGLWTTLSTEFPAESGPIKQTAVLSIVSADGVTLEHTTAFIVSFDRDIFVFRQGTYDDVGFPIIMGCRTRVQDFGTSRAKFLSRILYVGDYAPEPVSDSEGLQVRLYFDDQTAAYGTYPIPVNDNKPVAYVSGMFRNISLELVFTGNTAMRFKYLEIDYNQGDN